MKIHEIKQNAFAMPYTSPSALKIPYKFKQREYFNINYYSDLDTLRMIVPEPLNIIEPIVTLQFIKMPDAYGFGNYSMVSQMIEVDFEGKAGLYAHAMYLNNLAPIAAGREIWGFPEKLGHPQLIVDVDTIVGTLKYNNVDVAIGTMGYKYTELDTLQICNKMRETAHYSLKIIPDINLRDACLCQLVRYYLKDITVTGAWTGPVALQLFEHALAPLTQLAIKKIINAEHIIADLTLDFGEVVYDYLQ